MTPARCKTANPPSPNARRFTRGCLAQACQQQSSFWTGTIFPFCRSPADGPGSGDVGAGCTGHRLALVVGPCDHTVGCEGAFPAADPISCSEPSRGTVAVLGALRVQRPPAGRRPAIDDLLSAVSDAGARRRGAQFVGCRRHRAGDGGSRRRGLDAFLPRSGLALGGRADRGTGLQLRGIDGLAHPAHRPGAEPRLSADGARLSRSGPGAQLDPLRCRSRHCRCNHYAGARPGGAAGDLSPSGLRALAGLVRRAPARCRARQLVAARSGRNLRAGDHYRARGIDRRAGPGVRTGFRSTMLGLRAARCIPLCC